jgi:hypothetical protein
MRLIVAKIAISSYLVFMAYTHWKDEILENTLKEAVYKNIEGLNASDRFKEFLRLYLINIIYFTFFTSILTIISRSILPKMFNIFGLALWIYFSIHPNQIIQLVLQKILE